MAHMLPPSSPSAWPLDAQWLDELDVLLPGDSASFPAPFQAISEPQALSTAQGTSQHSNSSEDGEESNVIVSRPPDRRREYRQKKKKELLELRGASTKLQEQLFELLQRQKALTRRANGSKGLTAGWRGVALRQMQRRLAAESLNRELKIQIRGRHEAAVGLMEALRAQMAAVGESRAAELSRGQVAKPVMQLSERDVWDLSLLVREIDDLCSQASSRVQQAKMPTLEDAKSYNSRYSRTTNETSRVHSATFAEMMVMPFPVADAIPAMNKAFPIMISSECVPVIKTILEDELTVAVKFVWGEFEILSVSKSIEDSEHSEMAWRSIIRERGKASSAPIAEYGWGLAQAAEKSTSATEFQMFTLWRAEHPRAHTAGMVVPYAESLDRFAGMLVESSENDAAELAQTMENLLIDEVVARKQEIINAV